MANNEVRIAVATSDGIVVNNHFGRARKFYIYNLKDEELSFVEIREVTPVCDCGNHDEERLIENIRVIEDCQYLLVSKIGDGALAEVERFGINTYELPGIITDSVKQLIAFVKIKELFN